MALIPGYFSGSLSDTFNQYRKDKLLEVRTELRKLVKQIRNEDLTFFVPFSRASRMVDNCIMQGAIVRAINPDKLKRACAFAKVDICSSGIATDIFVLGPVKAKMFETVYKNVRDILESSDEGLNISVSKTARLAK